MAYLKAKQVKGKKYYQLVEAYREGGQRKDRVLLHLGTDLTSHESLLRWWNYLGRPRIPLTAGGPPKPDAIPSLATPCATTANLDGFLSHRDNEDLLDRVVEGLKFLQERQHKI